MYTLLTIVFVGGLLFVIQGVVDQSTEDDTELIFAHAICRHGERSIEMSYPKDPWKSEKYWPSGYAQLTNNGKEQAYELGIYLRERYAQLLGDGTYSPDKIYVRSTIDDRVLASAEACLAGLFPPEGIQKWNKDLNWQPVPVHTSPKSQDYVLSAYKPCDHYDALYDCVERNTLTKQYEPLLKYLEENTGKNITSLYDINKLHDTLETEQAKGYRLPSWAESVMKPGSDFEFLSLSRLKAYTNTTGMKKMKSGFLLKEILERFENKTRSILSPDRSLWLYFGHETTIANMLSSLGMFTLHRPQLASCIFFELYRSDEDSYVQIFYKNSTKNEFDIPAQFIPNCGTKCPLPKMFELYNDILPRGSFEEECKSL